MCDTVHILSRAIRECVNEQCCHKDNEMCGLSHHVKWLQKGGVFVSGCTTLEILKHNYVKICIASKQLEWRLYRYSKCLLK